MNPEELQNLLGIKAVLLPINKGAKCPFFKKWQKTTFADTQKEAYQKKLKSHGNTAVLLGQASEGLCSIDFDDDEALNDFLKLNPILNQTLRTQGKRGANLWIILTGDYPKSQSFKTACGKPAGEWRADGWQTVIQGTHPEGMPYCMVVQAHPLRMNYSEIQWGGLALSSTCHTDDIDDTDYAEIQSIQTNNKTKGGATLIEKEQHAKKALKKLKNNPDLYTLYRSYIMHKFTPRQGERNSQLVSMMTFLSRTVSRKRTLELAEAFYAVNQDVFHDTKEQHMQEAESHIKATLLQWEGELTEEDKVTLEELPSLQREAYRICRDLAHHESDQYPRGIFFLSCADLGRRLETDMKHAHRILAQLEGMKILSISNKGTRHSKQARGRATVYRMVL